MTSLAAVITDFDGMYFAFKSQLHCWQFFG
jgi:hypothetical protein